MCLGSDHGDSKIHGTFWRYFYFKKTLEPVSSLGNKAVWKGSFLTYHEWLRFFVISHVVM